MWRRVSWDGIPIELEAPMKILEQVAAWVNYPQKAYQIVTLNANILMQARRDPKLREIISCASLIVCDGRGILRALQQQGFVVEQLTGLMLTRALFSDAALSQAKVYCYGGSPAMTLRLQKVINKEWAGVQLMVADGYGIEKSLQQICAELLAWQPRVLIVGLGSPRQEYFLAELLPKLPQTIGIGVGGALEIVSGMKRETPDWIRALGGEWCFRMLQDLRKLKRLPELWHFYNLFLKWKRTRNLQQIVELLPEVEE